MMEIMYLAEGSDIAPWISGDANTTVSNDPCASCVRESQETEFISH
jgi:hypothetical protein